nr:acyl-CoA dehydrogenase C-terminal domain-containing protein [Paraburkholderia tuberum]
MARSLLAASQKQAENPLFNGAKIATAQFFAEHVLPQAVALKASIVSANGDAGGWRCRRTSSEGGCDKPEGASWPVPQV